MKFYDNKWPGETSGPSIIQTGFYKSIPSFFAI
jgi:hypothetical protein